MSSFSQRVAPNAHATQARLFPEPVRRGLLLARQGAKYQAANLEAAIIITAEIERYGGPEAGLVRWAHVILARAGECMREVA